MADDLLLWKRLPKEVLGHIAAYGFHLWLARPYQVTTFGAFGPFENLELHTTRHFVDVGEIPSPSILDLVPPAIVEAYMQGVLPACNPVIVEDPGVYIIDHSGYMSLWTVRWMRFQGEWWACPRSPRNYLLWDRGYMFEDGDFVELDDEPSDLDDA